MPSDGRRPSRPGDRRGAPARKPAKKAAKRPAKKAARRPGSKTRPGAKGKGKPAGRPPSKGRDGRRGSKGADDQGPELAGPAAWGRIARRGAGGMDRPGPDELESEPRRRTRSDGETGGRERRERPRELPTAEDLQKSAARAVARSRGPRRRDRRPLGARPRRPEEPATVVRRAVGTPRDQRLLKRLSNAGDAFQAERFGDARSLLQPLVKEVPELPEGRELMGLSLYRLGRWNDAIEHLEAFRDLTASTEQHPVLADCHRALGRWADVEELWSELGEASPAPALVTEGRIVLAGARADQGDLAGAIRTLEQGWKLPKRPRPDQLRRAYALADLYERAGKTPRARQLFAWIAGHDPHLADVAARVRALG